MITFVFTLAAAGISAYMLRLIQSEHANVEKARGEVERIVAEQKAVADARASIKTSDTLLPEIEKLYVHSEKVALFLDEVEADAKGVVPGFEFTSISVVTDPVDKNVVTLHMLASAESSYGELVKLSRALESLPYKIEIGSMHFYTDVDKVGLVAKPWTAEFDIKLLSYTSL